MLNKSHKSGPRKAKQDADLQKRSKEIIVNWLVAVVEFQRQYSQVNRCLDTFAYQQASLHETNWIGQSSTSQLVNLLINMRSQLEKFSLDIDQLEQESIAEKYDKLVDHTRLLEQFNQHARVLIQLTEIPAS